jgi:hypothetical protein
MHWSHSVESTWIPCQMVELTWILHVFNVPLGCVKRQSGIIYACTNTVTLDFIEP